jgi:hypothetical protein
MNIKLVLFTTTALQLALVIFIGCWMGVISAEFSRRYNPGSWKSYLPLAMSVLITALSAGGISTLFTAIRHRIIG